MKLANHRIDAEVKEHATLDWIVPTLFFVWENRNQSIIAINLSIIYKVSMLCYAVACYAVICYVMLCCARLCYIVVFKHRNLVCIAVLLVLAVVVVEGRKRDTFGVRTVIGSVVVAFFAAAPVVSDGTLLLRMSARSFCCGP